MSTARAVRVIQKSVDIVPFNVLKMPVKKRVAGYARVSTDSEEQLSSYYCCANHYQQPDKCPKSHQISYMVLL